MDGPRMGSPVDSRPHVGSNRTPEGSPVDSRPHVGSNRTPDGVTCR